MDMLPRVPDSMIRMAIGHCLFDSFDLRRESLDQFSTSFVFDHRVYHGQQIYKPCHGVSVKARDRPERRRNSPPYVQSV